LGLPTQREQNSRFGPYNGNYPDGNRKRRNDGKQREINSFAGGLQQLVSGEPAAGL
jgi:hypothetical protein